MARQKTSPLEDVILVTSKLPWWAGLSLAMVSYFVLHAVASRPVMPPTVAPGQMGDAFVKGLITTLATFGQYVLPFAFGLAALLSAINAARQKKIYNTVASRPGFSTLNEMSWEDFERLVAEYYRRSGFQVTREGGNGPDGGIDLILRQKSETYLVQCKQWKAFKVGVQPMREFYGVMASRGAAGGYFVTSGEYTEEAKAFVRGLNIELVDGRKLRDMIHVAQEKPTTPGTPADSRPAVSFPSCPKCGAEMKTRVARQGAHAGREFWGCTAFPKCNGTRPMEDSTGADSTTSASPTVTAPTPTAKSCPQCGTEMSLRQFQSGPQSGQYFYGCISCKKGWPVESAAS
ncbi:DNA topoisomerase 1 [Geobacteraceae bacterium]|nr:DNA topoisomerase 1 [Geobacteraceae bacterium]